MNPLLEYKDNIELKKIGDNRYTLTTDIDIVDTIIKYVGGLTETKYKEFSFAVNEVLLDTLLTRFIIDLFLTVNTDDKSDTIIIELVLNEKKHYISATNHKEFNGYIYNIS